MAFLIRENYYLCTRKYKRLYKIMKFLKKYLLDILAVVMFAVISFVYFMPADIDGRILYRHDASAGVGAGQERSQFEKKTGEETRWTNSIFGGMPTYQMAPSYKSGAVLKQASNFYHLWLPENVWYVFAYLLGFYILLRAFDFRQSLAALGSIIWAFSSYFFIIIAAGHIWKVMALAYLPPMIAGIVLAYRGKYLWGLLVTAIFTAFEVYANHVQMTYYYLFIILFMVIAFLVDAIRKKEMVRFGKATAVCIAGAAIGICLNLSNLYHTWQYGQETMRGKSELVKKNAANQTDSGLDRDYITQWSYGIDETWTLLIPNAKGGASVPLSQSQTAMEKADPNFMQVYQQLGQYWGDQPGTSGPVYVGAFVMMLFILGLFIVKGPMKWALLAATILSILLSWGRNFMPFTDFFLDYVPMYAKFRTVASILVIAEFTIPLLAMMALKRIVDEPELLAKKMKLVYVSFGLTAGFCALFALMPGTFFSDFVSAGEYHALQQIPEEYRIPLMSNLTEMRQAVFSADCWRSFWIIVIGTAFLFLYKMRKVGAEVMIAGIAILCLVDMWLVNKRYLYDDMFVEQTVRNAPQRMTETDKLILRDKSLDYRVLNLASNTLQQIPEEYRIPLMSNLTEMRQAVFSADCWRSFWIIVIGTAFLFLYKMRKVGAEVMIAGIAILCLVDMWLVNKRYLYDDMFVEQTVRNAPQRMTETDKLILRDKSLDYRVLNLASNTFNENETSYYHKSIGGYSAAKLRRYQEMIDAYIANEKNKVWNSVAEAGGDMTKVKGDSLFPVLNMLNTKYFIMPLQAGQTVPVQNLYAYGNAWFVDKVNYVNNANEEIAGVGKYNLRHEAVADAKFKEQLGQSVPQDDTSIVRLTQYKPNNLVYEVNSNKGGVVVFSEIYYPGWTATVDGQTAELGRVNYILRALQVKPGKHTVVLDFHPASLRKTETVAYVGYGILVLLIIIGIVVEMKKRKKEDGV